MLVCLFLSSSTDIILWLSTWTPNTLLLYPIWFEHSLYECVPFDYCMSVCLFVCCCPHQVTPFLDWVHGPLILCFCTPYDLSTLYKSLCLLATVCMSACMSVSMAKWLYVSISVNMSVCASVFLYICQSACLYLSVFLYVSHSVCMPVSLFEFLSTCMTIWNTVCMSVGMSVCLSGVGYDQFISLSILYSCTIY